MVAEANMKCPRDCGGRLDPIEDRRGAWFKCRSCGRELHQLAVGELADELAAVADGDGPIAKLAQLCRGEQV